MSKHDLTAAAKKGAGLIPYSVINDLTYPMHMCARNENQYLSLAHVDPYV